jgi:hypothetical protein
MPLRSLLAALAVVTSLRAQPAALSVNTSSREEVRQFFRGIYGASDGVPMQWTGSYATGNAGDISSAFREATRLRINFFRALVGVPADIRFNAEYNAKAQRAALLQSVNAFNGVEILLYHTPPPSWTFYSAEGAEGSARSNLSFGNNGAAAITSYVADSGATNATVGHRRWLFFPQTLQMGSGDVPGDGTNTRAAANATWILDNTIGGRFSDPRPPTRTRQLPYPPAGYVPYQVVWPRWSFSHPGADFAAATVTMTRNGQPVPVRLEPQDIVNGRQRDAGEPTLVWVYDNKNSDDETPHPRPSADTAYNVTVSNVRIDGAPQTFSYTVTVFDPDVAGPDASPVTVAGMTTPVVGRAASYTVAKASFVPAFDWRTVQLSSFFKTFNAEAGLDGISATTSAGYDVVQSRVSASGGSAYRLAHTALRTDQILHLPGTFHIAGADAAITFQSRLGILTETQVARVQVSIDNGNSWLDIDAQSGVRAENPANPPVIQSSFAARTVSLAPYNGRTIQVRFVLSSDPRSGGYVPTADNLVGWFIDTIGLNNVRSVTPSTPTRVTAGSTFSHVPNVAGTFGFQARGVIGGAYPLEWGPLLTATATGGDAASSYLANLSVRTAAGAGDDTLVVGFAVSGGTKRVLVRGIGPALVPFGVSGALVDPRLELYTGGQPAAKLTENDNWRAADGASFSPVGAFELAADSRDSAIVADLTTGSYSVQASGVNNTTGIALVELYDAAAGTSPAKLVNVSARSQVGTGDNILVAGFNIAGTGSRRLLIRAVGPTLAAFGVGGALADPRLELFQTQGGQSTSLATNDNWEQINASTFGRVGAFELTPNSSDAVLVVTLPPGSYTAQISGVNNTTGVALVELYELPPQ